MDSPDEAVRRTYPVHPAILSKTEPGSDRHRQTLGTVTAGRWIGSAGSSWVWMGRGRCTAVSPFQGLRDPGVIFPGRRPSPTRGLPWAVVCRPVGAWGDNGVRIGRVVTASMSEPPKPCICWMPNRNARGLKLVLPKRTKGGGRGGFLGGAVCWATPSLSPAPLCLCVSFGYQPSLGQRTIRTIERAQPERRVAMQTYRVPAS